MAAKKKPSKAVKAQAKKPAPKLVKPEKTEKPAKAEAPKVPTTPEEFQAQARIYAEELKRTLAPVPKILRVGLLAGALVGEASEQGMGVLQIKQLLDSIGTQSAQKTA